MTDLERSIDLLTGEALPWLVLIAWLAAGTYELVQWRRRRRRERGQ